MEIKVVSNEDWTKNTESMLKSEEGAATPANGSHLKESWTSWPGLALLPQANDGVVGLSAPPPSKKRMTMRKSASTAKYYCIKDRISFNGKPPLLAAPGFIDADSESPTRVSAFVLISCLAWWITDCDIREAVQSYGQIRAARVLSCPSTCRSTGLALVEFTNAATASVFESHGSPLLEHRSQSPIQISIVSPEIIEKMNQEMDQKKDAWVFGFPITASVLSLFYKLCGLDPPRSNQITSNAGDNSEMSSPPVAQLPCVAAAAAAALVLEQLKQHRLAHGINRSYRQDEDDYDFLETMKPIQFPLWPLHRSPSLSHFIPSTPSHENSLQKVAPHQSDDVREMTCWSYPTPMNPEYPYAQNTQPGMMMRPHQEAVSNYPRPRSMHEYPVPSYRPYLQPPSRRYSVSPQRRPANAQPPDSSSYGDYLMAPRPKSGHYDYWT